jgi:hypothetical protein
MRDTIKLGIIGVMLAFVVVGFSLFIKFFFRGIGLILQNPLEAVGFFGVLLFFSLIYNLMTEK